VRTIAPTLRARENGMTALAEIVRKLVPGDVRVLRRLPSTEALFLRGGDYDFACNLRDLGLATFEGGLEGWSAYVRRTERGLRVLDRLSMSETSTK
jgi:hypothetical protein